MKKSILVAALVLALCGSATAQTTFDIGLKAGAGMARLNIQGTDWRLGLDGGAFCNIKFMPSFSIQPEILFAMKGMGIKDADDLQWKLNYIEVPILVKRQISVPGNIKPVFFVGPVVSLLVFAKTNSAMTGVAGDVDIKDGFKSTDFGLCAGGGIEMPMGPNGKLTLDIRGTFSMTDNFDKTIPETGFTKPENKGLHNWNVALMVGYGFELGQKAAATP